MRAIDTNVVVRYLVADEPRQTAAARRLVDAEQIWVARTVLLESEWVLRSGYDYAPAEVCGALRAFAGLPTVSVESPDVVAKALDWFADGMDFADALHLAAMPEGAALATFDKRLIQCGKRLKAAPAVLP